jgi:hypothetical protein
MDLPHDLCDRDAKRGETIQDGHTDGVPAPLTERGVRNPTDMIVAKLAAALEVELYKLLQILD